MILGIYKHTYNKYLSKKNEENSFCFFYWKGFRQITTNIVIEKNEIGVVFLEILGIGHNNYIPKERISMILRSGSRPAKSLTSKAREQDRLIDAANGKKRRSIIITTDGFLVLSSLTTDTLYKRFLKNDIEELTDSVDEGDKYVLKRDKE